MNKEDFILEVEKLDVFDAHTHLVGDKLRASDFWEIVHYFWFLRELQGAGYPADYETLPEDDRIDAFLSAFKKVQGTGMCYAIKRIFRDLYCLEITDKDSVRLAIEKVKTSSTDEGWAKAAAEKGRIKHTIINRDIHKNFVGLDTCIWMPRVDGQLHASARRIFSEDTSKRAETAAEVRAELIKIISDYHDAGVVGFMTTLQGFNKKTYRNSGEDFADFDDCLIYLLHALCKAAEDFGMTVQFFMGMEHTYCEVAAPVNRSDRVLNLYGLFEKYKCDFDLVVASEANNMDVVNAAQIFRNVYVGGMWWFNFRPSTFFNAMTQRFEALASVKSYLSISDSRCIEWCYGKNALIKKLTSDFFVQKVSEGYVNYEEALDMAADWLYFTPAKLYGGRQ